MIAVDYERVFAEQAKKRQLAQLVQNRDGDTVGEILPQRSHAVRRGDLVPEIFPEPNSKGNESAEQAGDLFNVSGRTVRDAQKAPYWGRIRILRAFEPFPIPEYG